MGNFILFLPTLRILSETYSQAKFVLLEIGNNLIGSTTMAERYFNEIHYQRASFAGFLSGLNLVRDQQFDVAVQTFLCSDSPFVAGLNYFGGISHRVGYAKSSLLWNVYDVAYDIHVKLGEIDHETRLHAKILDALQITHDGELSTFLPVDDGSKDSILRRVSNRGVTPGDYICVCPGSGSQPFKRWPPERFGQLINCLSKQENEEIVVLGSVNERKLMSEIRKTLSEPVVDLVGETSLDEAFALLGEAKAVVANDSGLMQAADALETPLVAIIGPSDIRRTGPMKTTSHTVREQEGCGPCPQLALVSDDSDCGNGQCLESISVDQVIAKVRTLIAKY